MVKVEIYSGVPCPYCVKAKRLLDSKGIKYIEYDVSGNDELRAKMQERAKGARSIPQIFINDIHFGGCDDIYALDAKGLLNKELGL